MRRSRPLDERKTPSNGNYSDSMHWRTPRVSSRRVTLDEPWQDNIYSVPRPTRWTPEMTEKDSRDRTPYPIQSPPTRDHEDELSALKHRMDRQEDMMIKMMSEITLLRRQLLDRNSSAEPLKKAEEGATANVPKVGEKFEFNYRQSVSSHSEGLGIDWNVENMYCPRANTTTGRPGVGTAGAEFVAEFSEFIELEAGQHELLASIMDRHLSLNRLERR